MKNKLAPVILILLVSTVVHGQTLPTQAFKFAGGYSKHGSGDLNGVIFGAEYSRYLTQKFSVSINMRGTINDGQATLIVNEANSGSTSDNSLHYTTAGVQLGVDAGLSLVRTLKHEVKASLGAFGRYQSNSLPGGYAIHNPNQTNQPAFLIEFLNSPDTPRETFSIGGGLQIEYSFTFKNKIQVGISPGLQTDINGDTIPFCALKIGKLF